MPAFTKVNPKTSFPEVEQGVLNFWRERGIFAQSVQQRRGNREYVFYDGPPFATGLPHYGHLLASTIKDVVPRYRTMCGDCVDRVFGWDCHGLPVENEMEKELGINSKKQIEEYGIARFNEACRGIVLRYTGEWETVVNRLGRWADFQRGYRTMDRNYMESIWWVFKTLWDQGLIYEGHKIMAYCPRCATPLSNFETSQGYAEAEDPAITVRFRLVDQPNTYVLAWTTTPWTLPSNLALATGPEVEYVEVADGDVHYILAAARLDAYYRKEKPPVVRRCTGAELAGLRYEPLFPYFAHLAEAGAFRVVNADFVSTGDGTGIVHMAPGFGEDDALACAAAKIPSVCPIDAECKFNDEVPEYRGRYVKDCDPDLIQRLKQEGKLVQRGTIKHNYPHCWRCDSPLIYRAISTWFVRVEAIKERMLAANAQIAWMPAHLKDGRFGKWLENARDWAVSRNRYWGCPLPIWRNETTGEIVCLGSIAELEQRCGRKVEDIHKHYVDDLVLPGAQGGELRRVPEVLDCWFESGSMPYAQHHYPFENKEWVEQHFPADFIAEGLDQTRGWFYTLVVLGAALFDKPSFRNVVVNGLILAEDGRKMSKRLKNYPAPDHIMNTYGADALRLYLLNSPVVRAEDLCFSEKGVQETLRSIILPLWNSYSFFVTYALVDDWRPAASGDAPPERPANPLDQWLLSRLENLVATVRDRLDHYDLQGAASSFAEFTELLTNWYIRRSRRRFWKSQNDADKSEAYATLHHVLVSYCKVAAPFIPFVTEAIYRNLRTPAMPESVHLCDYPVAAERYVNRELDRRMAHAMTAVSLGRFLRRQADVKVRQPLRHVVLVSLDERTRADLAAMDELIRDELNVKQLRLEANEAQLVNLSAKANFPKLGPRLGKAMKAAASIIAQLPNESLFALLEGRSVTVDIPGHGPCELTKDDIEIRRQEKEGLAVANQGDVTVALDLHLDEELLDEGWVREAVHVVQGLRRDADLEVSDRIRLRCDCPPPVAVALRKHRDYVIAETLAETVELPVALEVGQEAQIGEHRCRFAIAKV